MSFRLFRVDWWIPLVAGFVVGWWLQAVFHWI